jgi:hypothetical protein
MSWFVRTIAVGSPRRSVGARLGKRSADVIALDETQIGSRMTVVSGLFTVAEVFLNIRAFVLGLVTRLVNSGRVGRRRRGRLVENHRLV